MNCRRVEKLIPLFIEGDLESRLTDRLASHLEWCGRCNWLADEYKESQSWLRSCATPEFDEALVDDLKRSVLTRTGEMRLKPSLFSSLLQQWGRRQVLALSAAMLVVLGVLVFYVYQARMSLTPVVPEVVEQIPGHHVEESQQPDLAADREQAPEAGLQKRYRRSRNRPRIAARQRSPIIAIRNVEPPPVTQTNAAAEQTAMPADSSVDSRMLRIEIQTSDPNIRIIWFAPKETDLDKSKPATD